MQARALAAVVANMVVSHKGHLSQAQASFMHMDLPEGEPRLTTADMSLFTHSFEQCLKAHKAGLLTAIAAARILNVDAANKPTGKPVTELNALEATALMAVSCFVRPKPLYEALLPHVTQMKPDRAGQAIAAVKAPSKLFVKPVAQAVVAADVQDMRDSREAKLSMLEGMFAEVLNVIRSIAYDGAPAPTNITPTAQVRQTPTPKPLLPQASTLTASPIVPQERIVLDGNGEAPVFPSGKPRNQRLDLSNEAYARWSAENLKKARAAKAVNTPKAAAPKAPAPSVVRRSPGGGYEASFVGGGLDLSAASAKAPVATATPTLDMSFMATMSKADKLAFANAVLDAATS